MNISCLRYFSIVLSAFLITLSFTKANAQDNDNLVFKDGKTFPGKGAMIAACAKSFDNEAGDTKEVRFDGEGICTCMFEGLATRMTYKEFMTNITSESFINKITNDKKNPYHKMVEECVTSHMRLATDSEKLAPKPTLTKEEKDKQLNETIVEACKTSLQKSNDVKSTGIDADKFCRCAVEKVMTKDFPLEKVGEVMDPNSPLFDKTMTPCLNEAMGEGTKKSPQDITGKVNRQEIPISKLASVSRVTVKIGKYEKLFILDSGAGDVMISSDFERDLILDGLVHKKDYLDDKMYQLADGSKVTCRRFNLNGFQIGDFTVNNVTVAVIDKENITFLMGKSVLDKFSHWSVNNQTGKLVLEK